MNRFGSLLHKATIFINADNFTGFQMGGNALFFGIYQIPMQGRFIEAKLAFACRSQFSAVSGIGVGIR